MNNTTNRQKTTCKDKSRDMFDVSLVSQFHVVSKIHFKGNTYIIGNVSLIQQ